MEKSQFPYRESNPRPSGLYHSASTNCVIAQPYVIKTNHYNLRKNYWLVQSLALIMQVQLHDVKLRSGAPSLRQEYLGYS